MKPFEPIAVYCVEKKKCVMLFKDYDKCDRYVFSKVRYQSSRSRYLTKAKGKTFNNYFGKNLAFRFANTKQKEMLDTNECLVLDEGFIRECIKVNVVIKLTS